MQNVIKKMQMYCSPSPFDVNNWMFPVPFWHQQALSYVTFTHKKYNKADNHHNTDKTE